jgi:hypothetical protein
MAQPPGSRQTKQSKTGAQPAQQPAAPVAASTPPPASAPATDGDKPIRTVGPTFLPKK